MDCHNRPSHSFKSANDYLDNALISGLIPEQLPYIKKAAMKALDNHYTSTDTALMEIRNNINTYYESKHFQIFTGQKALIDQAIAGI
jgi:hypothetical protein